MMLGGGGVYRLRTRVALASQLSVDQHVSSCYYSAIATLDCSCDEWLESAGSHFWYQSRVTAAGQPVVVPRWCMSGL
jgi:hypothetical protein